MSFTGERLPTIPGALHVFRLDHVIVATVPIDKCKPNEWNPNEQDEATFNRLAEELDQTQGGVGYIDLVQVIPMTDGTFTIIGGEHRWRAMRALGHETIDVVLLVSDQWKSRDLQEFTTVRLNALKGTLNPKKFMAMYNRLAQSYSADQLKRLMAFTDEDKWREMTRQTVTALQAAGVSKEAISKFKKDTKEIKKVDDLANILNRLFNEHGNTLDAHYMVFSFGGKEHIKVDIDPKTFKTLKRKLADAFTLGVDAGKLFSRFISGSWDLSLPELQISRASSQSEVLSEEEDGGGNESGSAESESPH